MNKKLRTNIKDPTVPVGMRIRSSYREKFLKIMQIRNQTQGKAMETIIEDAYIKLKDQNQNQA